jgi:hypothetical protein
MNKNIELRLERFKTKVLNFFNDVKVDLTIEKLMDGSSVEIDEVSMQVFVVNEDGSRGDLAKDGEYELQDGTKIVVKDGIVSEVIVKPVDPVEETIPAETVMNEQLSADNVKLSSQVKEIGDLNVKLESELKDATSKVEELTKKVEELTNQAVVKLAKTEEKNKEVTGPMTPKRLAQIKLSAQLQK